MKRILSIPFGRFSLMTVYSLLSGILLSLALNLFVSTRLATDLSADEGSALYVASASLFFAAIGFYYVMWNLDVARTDWEKGGAVNNQTLMELCIQNRLPRLFVGLLMGIVGTFVGLILIAIKRIPFWT